MHKAKYLAAAPRRAGDYGQHRHSSKPGPVQVAICIGTFKRRDLLRKLLSGLSDLAFRKMPAPEISVVVVDNDSARSAEDVVAAAQLPWAKKYVVEPRRGIACVRNRAVFE